MISKFSRLTDGLGNPVYIRKDAITVVRCSLPHEYGDRPILSVVVAGDAHGVQETIEEVVAELGGNSEVND